MAKNNIYIIYQTDFGWTVRKKTIILIADSPKDAYEKWLKQSKRVRYFNFLKDCRNGKIYYKKDIFKNR